MSEAEKGAALMIKETTQMELNKPSLKSVIGRIDPYFRMTVIEAALGELAEDERRDRLIDNLKDIPTDELERISSQRNTAPAVRRK